MLDCYFLGVHYICICNFRVKQTIGQKVCTFCHFGWVHVCDRDKDSCVGFCYGLSIKRGKKKVKEESGIFCDKPYHRILGGQNFDFIL